MSAQEDDWVQLAFTDDTLVVQLLSALKQTVSSSSLSPPQQPYKAFSPALKIDWSVRQRRSKQISRKKSDAATRASPTTPLSWSGGTSSVSGGGFEESSCLPATNKTVDTARSKVAVTNETQTTKRSRKKRTLHELKEEESFLLTERISLKNLLDTLRLTVENQRAENESLKRLKVDLLSRQTPHIIRAAVKAEEIHSLTSKQINLSHSMSQLTAACNKLETFSSDATFQKQEDGDSKSGFMLPDLNVAVEDYSGTDILCGIS
ncbi:uncharacterized protein LOC126683123 [Mercurialis annua]|uniref:uncharacterized protein LOC126683123 n=1 Tax=Mercurialis annua TaxID=3986 RepID=UPI00216062A0|nr:uncharacterized protein LOC126683123 [Mercurialis annua]